MGISNRNTDVNAFDEIVRWLSNPTTYPHRPDRVEVVETHISVVFVAGPLVYKLKRPVKYDFLDFTTIEKREAACREELRLNRRLAPDIYLDVVPITRDSHGALQFGGERQPLDWLVQMRRLPMDQTLEALFQRGELRSQHIDRLAQVLAEFYCSLTPQPVTPEEYRRRYVAHVEGNLRELLAVSHHCPTNTVRRIHSFQLQLLQLEPELFDERVRVGRIVEGHGDLRPEHICFSDPPVIFDCIEFSLDFRRIDVADEIAFLAAECDFLGAAWVGPQLFQSLATLSDDVPPPKLVDFYKSYRACVRAKVAALRADQLQGTDYEVHAAEALKHLSFANAYVKPWLRPIVLLVGGLSGTGKSTVANAMAEALGCELLRTDIIRRELFGNRAVTNELNAGIYTADSRQQVYAELFRRARALCADRVSIVLDGTFSNLASVQEAQRLASESHANFFAIECVCSPQVAQQRIENRLSGSTDASQAWPELHDQQRDKWEAWPGDVPHVRLDTEQPLAVLKSQIVDALRRQIGRR